MNWTKFGIIFSTICMGIFLISDINIYQLNALNLQQKHYNQVLDRAVDDGVANLVEVSTNNELILSKEKAINQFYYSLFSNFGVLGNSLEEEKLRNHIPIILVTDEDGFFIQYSEEYTIDDESILVKRWSEKLPYVFKEDNLIYQFTLSSYLKIYNINTNEVVEGYVSDLKDLYPDSIMNDSNFDTVRRNSIISSIEKQMNYYINQYNNIAGNFDITYRFWVPAIEKTDWHRTIDDRSLLVLFQGYPYRNSGIGTFNRYSFGGSRLKKSKIYVVTEEQGIKYYHRTDCIHNDSEVLAMYYSREECAAEGAFPCLLCNP